MEICAKQKGRQESCEQYIRLWVSTYTSVAWTKAENRKLIFYKLRRICLREGAFIEIVASMRMLNVGKTPFTRTNSPSGVKIRLDVFQSFAG